MLKMLLTLLLSTILLSSCATKSTKRLDTTISGVSHTGSKIEVDPSQNESTILVFLSASCPCSDSHIPIIKKLSKSFPKVQFLGIHSNYNEKKKRALKYFAKQKLDFPVIHDSESLLAKQFGALKTPHVFILNSNSDIIYKGSVTNASLAKFAKVQHLENALVDISNGKSPRVPKRKTLGCYIPIKE